MSGPKISVYSLTGSAASIVAGQMLCEQQSLACYRSIQDIIQSIRSNSSDYEKQTNNLQLLIKRTSEGTEQLNQLQSIWEEIERETKDIGEKLKDKIPHVSEKYTITIAALTEKQAELRALQALQRKAERVKAKIDSLAFQNQKNTSKIQASIINDLGGVVPASPEKTSSDYLKRSVLQDTQKIQASILNDISSVTSFEIEEDTETTGVSEKKETIVTKLKELLNEPLLPESLQNEIDQAIASLSRIEDERFLQTFETVTVKNLFIKADDNRSKQEQARREYKDLCIRYESLCEMAGESPISIPPYSGEAVSVIGDEIKRLEQQIVRQQEQVYITKCVNEVMSEMGYDIIGSREVRKKSGRHFRNELFSFNEGTAVNVTYSPDGQISMELGGLDREDRIPTKEEEEVLTSDMESFCSEFEEFEKRMRARGVIVSNRIALSPPSSEYAAIINVSDYDISDSTQIALMNVTEKKRKQSERKVMRQVD